jgi:hypothetical protein
MRTTIAVDDDVYFAVKERARRERRSAGAVLSELARQALTGTATSVAKDNDIDDLFGFEPIRSRGGVVSNELIDQLRDDEAE